MGGYDILGADASAASNSTWATVTKWKGWQYALPLAAGAAILAAVGWNMGGDDFVAGSSPFGERLTEDDEDLWHFLGDNQPRD